MVSTSWTRDFDLGIPAGRFAELLAIAIIGVLLVSATACANTGPNLAHGICSG